VARPQKEYQHGEYGMYTLRKCRCDECKSIAAKVRMKYRGEDFEDHPEDVQFRLPAQPFIDFLTRTGQLSHVPEANIRRWLVSGMDMYRADAWAIKFHSHPMLIWGMDFYRMRPGVVLEDA